MGFPRNHCLAHGYLSGGFYALCYKYRKDLSDLKKFYEIKFPNMGVDVSKITENGDIDVPAGEDRPDTNHRKR